MNPPETSKVFYSIYQVSKNYSGDWKNEALNNVKSELNYDFVTLENIEFIPLEHDLERFTDENLDYYRLKITLDQEIQLDDEMKKDWLERHKDNL